MFPMTQRHPEPEMAPRSCWRREVERFSGLSHTTLWRYVNREELKATWIEQSVQIGLSSLQEFMKQAAEDSNVEGGLVM